MAVRTRTPIAGGPPVLGGDGLPVIGEITAANLVSFTRRLAGAVSNWPEVLSRLALASAGVKRGEIKTVLRDGGVIVSPASRAAWWPTFELFVEDVYRLGDLTDVRLGPTDVVLDLGAHLGTSAVLFARRWPEATVVCVEPNPETVAYLETNLSSNNVRAVLRHEAVGALDGRATLFGTDDASCEASTSFRVPGSSREVPVVAFERLMREAPGPVRVVKLDCEGAEHEVLGSSTPALWGDVEVVLLEYHRTSDRESSWPATEARVNALGFVTCWEMAFSWRPGLGMAGFRRSGSVS
ncbi:MAG: FkbM family methyltransferase [Acidimicrobiales bacterium]